MLEADQNRVGLISLDGLHERVHCVVALKRSRLLAQSGPNAPRRRRELRRVFLATSLQVIGRTWPTQPVRRWDPHNRALDCHLGPGTQACQVNVFRQITQRPADPLLEPQQGGPRRR